MVSTTETITQQQQQQQIRMGQGNHPMIPVPDAIRIVMKETARILLEKNKNNSEQRQHSNQHVINIQSSSWSELLNCCVDEDVLMKEPGYPPYNASIMDGYAIRTNEFSIKDAAAADKKVTETTTTTTTTTYSWTHQVIDKVYAGDDTTDKKTTSDSSDDSSLPSALYITTGAVVPKTYNCVVPIEECQVFHHDAKQYIQIAPTAKIQDQEWIRPVGCDIPSNSIVLPKNHILDPVAIGLLLQSGTESIVVKRKIKVGVLSTGNELVVDASSTASASAAVEEEGKIPDVNRPILLSLLSTYGNCCEPIDLGMVRDDSVDDMAITMKESIEQCDVIITTGGVSMGETDIVVQVLVDKCGGTLHFGRMHMKPGKPTTFVTVPRSTNNEQQQSSSVLVFAMPGNPVSATVCTQLLVKPCLDLYFQGIDKKWLVENDQKTEAEQIYKIVQEAFVHPEIEGVLSHDVKLDNKRPEYHRVQVEIGVDGSYIVSTTGNQRSSRLMSLRDAEALLVLPHAHGVKTKALRGEKYPVLLLNNNSLGVKPVRIEDSVHLKKKGAGMKVGVIEVLPSNKEHLSNLDPTCVKIQDALSGSKSGDASVVFKRTFSDSVDKLYTSIVDSLSENSVDIVVVSCNSFDGCFSYHLDVSNILKKKLIKVANSLSLQARQGAASNDPKAALFEVVVGYTPESQGAMVVCVPDTGVEGALSNTRGLLKHGLNLARGQVHNHHHTHKHHDHATN